MNKVVAIGAGRMGRGIAQVFAFAGHKVSIIDFKNRTSEQKLSPPKSIVSLWKMRNKRY